MFPFRTQEDDIEGIHIVAFAEEEDPGTCWLLLIQPYRQTHRIRTRSSFPAVVCDVASRWF